MRKDTLSTHTEQEDLVNAIKANDERSMKKFYRDNYYKIEKYVLNNHGTEEEAKDVYQDAFIAVWRNIQLNKFKPHNGTALTGYLFSISKHKWLDYLRSGHHKKMVPLQNEDYMELPQQEYMSEEENEYLHEVKKYFKKLGDNCQEILSRFYYHKQPLKIIAGSFDWTEATTRNNKYRCLQRLRDMIKNKND